MRLESHLSRSLVDVVRRATAGAIVLMGVIAADAMGDAFEFRVVGIECKLCAPPIQKALAAVRGVGNARVDWKKGMATVEIPPGFDKTKLKAALENLGFEAVFPGETARSLEPLPPEDLAKLDVRRFDGTEPLDERSLAVSGKTTLVDYYGDWCGPCRVLEIRITRYMTLHSDIALRRVDIGKWDNAAARQITRLGAASLPYVRVYDAAGKFLGSGGMWDEVLELIEKSRQTQ